ncbi:MAG: hypothetical protein WCK01_00575 [Candidatus Uhrbacteria bacterium]
MTMNSKSLFLVVPLTALVLLGQGCGAAKPAAGPDGGIFRTVDAGDTWNQLKVINIGPKQASIAAMGIVTMAVDPQDGKTLYAGTVENGVIYTVDDGASWAQAPAPLNTGRIQAVAVDAKDKCTVYATMLNQIMKTTTCSRDWTRVYFDPRTDKSFTALAVDWYNSDIVYAGTNDGDILRSDNAGVSWRVVVRLNAIRMNQIVLDPRDSRTVYAATAGSGLLKTVDGGQNWVNIRSEFDGFDGSKRVNYMALDPSNAGRIFTVSKYGLLLSDDAGVTWTALSLPTPPGSVDVKAFAIDPKDPKHLVYATTAAVIWSTDSGQTWTTKKLPSSRGAAVLIYDGSSPKANAFLGSAPAAK